MPSDVELIYKKLQDCGFERISFHAHNNLQLAFTNTIKAIELGAYSVDATVFGMGRGGGNLPVEVLLKYLGKEASAPFWRARFFYFLIPRSFILLVFYLAATLPPSFSLPSHTVPCNRRNGKRPKRTAETANRKSGKQAPRTARQDKPGKQRFYRKVSASFP